MEDLDCVCKKSPCECDMFEIRPVKTTEITDARFAKQLPSLDRLKMLVVGASYSGKSTLLYNLLKNNRAFGFRKFFKNNIFIFSPTLESDEIYKKIKEEGLVKEENMFDRYDWSIINDIYLEQKENSEIPVKKRPHVLIVLDDVATDLKGENQKRLINAFATFRHWRISFYITAQNYRMIPFAVRGNANALIIFPSRMNEKELDAVWEEQSLKKPEWNSMIEYVQKNYPYSFIYINPEQRQIKDRYFIDFNKKVLFQEKEKDT